MEKPELNGFMPVYTDTEKAEKVLREFKEKDFGLSVVASGWSMKYKGRRSNKTLNRTRKKTARRLARRWSLTP
jgi:hypothetical protein